jgi:hypothetical protein
VSNYIHNGHINDDPETGNLRMDMDSPVFHSTHIDSTHTFVVAIFAEKIGNDWESERAFCGFIDDVHNKDALVEGLKKIMRTGAEPYKLAKWLVEKDCVF